MAPASHSTQLFHAHGAAQRKKNGQRAASDNTPDLKCTSLLAVARRFSRSSVIPSKNGSLSDLRF
jgi:hypothetical protein